MAIDYTPWVDGVTQYSADQMNAPLTELKDSAQEECDAKVTAPDGNSDGYVPQWDGEDSGTLKDGLEVVTTLGDPGADTAIPTEAAVRAALGAVGGAEAFTDLTDVPSDYTDQGGKLVAVNGDEDALEFVAAPAAGASDFTDLGDVPSDYTDDANKFVRVASGEAALEFHALLAGVGIGFEAAAKPAASGVYSCLVPYAVSLPANLTGSAFYNAANPSAEVVVSLKKNGTEFGTLTVTSGGSPTFAAASPTSLAAGDRLTFAFPASQDSTWAGVLITLAGTRSG
jgi:hypothetical protein